MTNLTYNEIKKYKELVEENSTDFGLILGNYKSNVRSISLDIDNIKFDYWDDNVATSFSAYKEYLCNGVISKMVDSISSLGSLTKLDELVGDLKNKCKIYLTNIEDIKEKYTNVVFDTDMNNIVSGDNIDETIISTINSGLLEQRNLISDILDDIKNLKFDDEVSIGVSEMPEFVLPDSISSSDSEQNGQKKEPIILNQFDKIMVTLENGEHKPMYYLGTDSKGRSYFSESLDNDAIAYRGVIPGQADTAQTYLNDTETLAQPGFVEARIGFVLFGGNTGDMTVGNVLEKTWNGEYINGAYTGDADFNNSLVFEDGDIDLEIVERGSSQYDADRAYHCIIVDNLSCVSLSEIYDTEKPADLSEHPPIVLKPGEKIVTKYNGTFLLWEVDWGILKESWTIGKEDAYTYLVWNEDKQAYYVVNADGGYYTADHVVGGNGRIGYAYVYESDLMSSETNVTIK